MSTASPPDFKNLGLALRVLRDLGGLSQAHVARSAGIGKSQLSKYENGKELPKLDSLARVLGLLGVSVLGFFKVMEVLDRLERLKEDSFLLVEGDLGPLVLSEEQTGLFNVVRELFRMFEAQVVTRVRQADLRLREE